MNEIDENAKNLRKELYDADEDLERRIKLSDKMHTMVSAVSEATVGVLSQADVILLASNGNSHLFRKSGLMPSELFRSR